MGILDSITSMVGGGAGENGKVAGGLLDALREHPGGIGGVMQQMQQNGQGAAVQQWSQGNTGNANEGQIESGVGSGLINSIAERTGVSPTAVKSALVVLLPLVVHHMTSSGTVTADGQSTGQPMPDHGSILSSILSRLG